MRKTKNIEYGDWMTCTKGWVLLSRRDLMTLLREMDDFMDRHYDGERRHCDTVTLNLSVANYTEKRGLHMRERLNYDFYEGKPQTADIRDITSEEFDCWKGRSEDRRQTLEEFENLRLERELPKQERELARQKLQEEE